VLLCARSASPTTHERSIGSASLRQRRSSIPPPSEARSRHGVPRHRLQRVRPSGACAGRPEQARLRGHERRLLVVEQRERADLCRARGRSERPHQARSGVAVTCEWHRLVAAGAPRRRCRSRAGWGFLRSAAVAAMGRLWLEPATLGRERRCAFLVGVHAEITVGRDGRGGQQLRLLGVAGCVTG
jgi:hypothetical protein